jgi:hypothetical protein
VNRPDDETPLPAALPHHEADPTSQRERVPADEVADVDPEDLLATRPHEKLEPMEPDPSDLFSRPPDPTASDDFDDEERTPPPRFLQQPGNDHDATLPRDRHLVDDDEDTET